MMNNVYRISLFVGAVMLLFFPGHAVSESPVDKLADKSIGKWPSDRYEVFSSANDCVDAKSDTSLPFAKQIVEWTKKSFKERGYRITERFTPDRETLLIKCRWEQISEEINVTFQVVPWEQKRAGTSYTVSLKIPVNLSDGAAFIPDLESLARTLVHRLERNKGLLPQNVYVKPFGSVGGAINETVEMFFDQWLRPSLRQSSVFAPLDENTGLYGLSSTELRSRAVRPELKGTGSLTGDLLQADSELSFRVRTHLGQNNAFVGQRAVAAVMKTDSPSPQAPAQDKVGSSSAVVVSAWVTDRQGKKLTESEVNIPSADLPVGVQTALTDIQGKADTVDTNSLKLEMTTTKGAGIAHYRNGEKMQFLIRSNFPAHVYLFNLDSSGKAVLLYPAFGTKQGAIPESRLFIIPDDSLHYELKVQPPFGKEKIWAVAATKPLAVPQTLEDKWADNATVKQMLQEIAKKSDVSFAEQEILIQTDP